MTKAEARPLHQPLLGIALRIGAMAVFAIMAAIIKALASSGLPEAELIFFRSLFGLLPVLIWMLVFRQPDIVKTRYPRAHIIRSLVGLASMFFMFMGLARLPLNDAAAIGFTAPIFATLMSAAVLGERIGIHRTLAIAAGFAGVLVLTGAGANHLFGSGAIFMLAAAVLGAAVSITIRQISRTEHSITITFYFMLAGIVITGAAMPFIWVSPEPESWLLIVALGLTGGILQIMLSAALRYAPVSIVLPFDYSQIVFTGLLSWLLWSELPTTQTITGGSIIIASGLYIFYREAVRRAPPTGVASPVDEG